MHLQIVEIFFLAKIKQNELYTTEKEQDDVQDNKREEPDQKWRKSRSESEKAAAASNAYLNYETDKIEERRKHFLCYVPFYACKFKFCFFLQAQHNI